MTPSAADHLSADGTPVAVALIGYGYAGETFHAPLIAAEPRLKLVVVGSSRPERVTARWGDVRVVADPLVAATDPAMSLVVIASPNDSHAPLARAALEAGKHVVVDKPFTLTLADARALAGLAAERGQVLSVFHNRRWDSDFLTVRAAIAGSAIGETAAIESRIDRWRPQVRERWREGAGAGAGLLFDLGPHLIDQALCLFGPPDTVSAWTARQRPGALADDAFSLTLRWGERAATLSAGMLVGSATPRWLVQGTNGTLVKQSIDPQEAQLKSGIAPGAPGWGEDEDSPYILAGDTGDRRTMAAKAGDQRAFYAGIADAVQGRGPNPVTPEQACTVMSVLEAARLSASSGCTVSPDLTAAERTGWKAGALP